MKLHWDDEEEGGKGFFLSNMGVPKECSLKIGWERWCGLELHLLLSVILIQHIVAFLNPCKLQNLCNNERIYSWQCSVNKHCVPALSQSSTLFGSWFFFCWILILIWSAVGMGEWAELHFSFYSDLTPQALLWLLLWQFVTLALAWLKMSPSGHWSLCSIYCVGSIIAHNT